MHSHLKYEDRSLPAKKVDMFPLCQDKKVYGILTVFANGTHYWSSQF